MTAPLTLLWTAPLLGGFLTLLLAGDRAPRLPRRLALLIATALFLYTAAIPLAAGSFNLTELGLDLAWGIRYSLALDGLSYALVLLTAFLTMISLLGSWKEGHSAGFWASFLFLESALMGVFLARDLFLFYIFWEASLIPMFFIIGLWGSANRRHAAVKFFLYTFGGSLFLLLGALLLVNERHAATGLWSWDMSRLRLDGGGPLSVFIFISMAIGFAVKIPVFPFHTWLPDAHTEAPAAGSVMLAGVMLKMGLYGFLRILYPVFPGVGAQLLPWLGGLAAFNAIYGAFGAMVQTDLKRLIAYSSVAHLGFCLMGIASLTPEGIAGGSLQMINHGLTTGALFLMVGFIYERSHKRGLSDFGALARTAPALGFFFGLACLASVGVPGMNGFVGEFMSLAGMMRALPIAAMAALLGVGLAPAYLLPAFGKVFWNDPGPDSCASKVTDLDGRERAILWALSGLMLVIGLYPSPWLDFFRAAASQLSL